MFRPLLGHLQALWENRSNSYLHFNALWDPKCLQVVLYEREVRKFVYIGKCGGLNINRLQITLDNEFQKVFFCICDEYVINLFVCIYEVRKAT